MGIRRNKENQKNRKPKKPNKYPRQKGQTVYLTREAFESLPKEKQRDTNYQVAS